MYWQSLGESHGTTNLLKAIVTLEAYPQFEKIIPKLKKELESRFRGIKPGRRGYKILGNIRLYPNGYCQYKCYHSEGGGYKRTVLSPFKVKIKKENNNGPKRKVSQTRLAYKHKFYGLPLLYKLCAYDKVGMIIRIKKDSKGYFDEENISMFLEKEKEILGADIPDKIKKELFSGIRRGLFKHKDWKWEENHYDGHDFNRIFITELARKFIGCRKVYDDSDLIIGPTLIKKGDSCYSRNSSERIIINMDTEYRVIFPLPTKNMIQKIVDNGAISVVDKKWDEQKKGYVNVVPQGCPIVVCNFNTFNEFISQFKDMIYSVKNPSIVDIMKRIGLKVEESKEVKEIKNTSVTISGALRLEPLEDLKEVV